MATTQIIGFTTANTLEVEKGSGSPTNAARATLRAGDYGAGGVFNLAGASGIMGAALTAASPIWSFRWGSAALFALVKRITLSAGNDTVAFAAGLVLFNLFSVRSFVASDSGGTSLTPAAGKNKLRTSMADSLLTDCRIATTGALTAGTRAIDGDPIATVGCGVPATIGAPMVPPGTILFEARPGEYPLVLAQNEGLVLQSGGVAIAATGTWKFGVTIEWSEKATYPV